MNNTATKSKPPKKVPVRQNNLAKLRKRSHLKQEHVAKLLGITVAAVSRHESHDRAISEDLVERYADIYDVPTHKLFA